MAIGGGVDFKVSHRFSIRAVQVDYLMTHFNEFGTGAQNQNNLRVSTGLRSASTSVVRCRQQGPMRQAWARCTFCFFSGRI